MQSSKTAITVPRTIAIMLFVLAMGMLGARIFAGLDIPALSIMGLLTVGTALMVVAQSNAKSSEKPD